MRSPGERAHLVPRQSKVITGDEPPLLAKLAGEP
jgi:hypothetical protein